MDIPVKAPSFKEKDFTCPHCRAFAQQFWFETRVYGSNDDFELDLFQVSKCARWRDLGSGLGGGLMHPATRRAPPANPDLADEIKRDEDEAAGIEQRSPNGAAAHLRLCLQRLCGDLGQKGENIYADLKAPVLDGLPVEIQQARDVVRVFGNDAAHPGTIDREDNPEMVSTLFPLITAMADRMITQRKTVAELYGALPPGVSKQIKKRDAAKP